MRSAHISLSVAVLLALGCGAGASPMAVDQTVRAGGGTDAGTSADASAPDAGDDPDPAFSPDELVQLAALAPKSLPAAPKDVSNRFSDDPRAAALGQKLFFETAFSGPLLDGDNDGSSHALGNKGEAGKVSCAGCHVPEAGFLDDRTLNGQISLAAGWGRRRTPSLLDVGQASLLMWDGRRDALYNQPFGPLESPVEMNTSRLYTAERVFELYRAEYEAIFGPMPALGDTKRFPALSVARTGCQPTTVDPLPTCNGTRHGMPGDGAEFDALPKGDQDAVTQVVVNLGKAIGAYERLLTCGASRFDAWVDGQAGVLSRAEQRGAELFVGRGKCTTCHSGPYLSDQHFHNVGLQPTTVAAVFIDTDDEGAIAGVPAAQGDPLNVAGKFSDGDDGRLSADVGARAGAFRTPILRCLAKRPSFMHTGQLGTLRQVVQFFARGGDTFGYPGQSEIAPVTLSSRETDDLTAFLGTLEGTGPQAPLLSKP